LLNIWLAFYAKDSTLLDVSKISDELFEIAEVLKIYVRLEVKKLVSLKISAKKLSAL